MMRIFMLGWEFPPFISGGLGTACYGLTKALSKQDQVTFVLPKTVESDLGSHVKLLSPQASRGQTTQLACAASQAAGVQATASTMAPPLKLGESAQAFDNVTFKAVPSRISSPYGNGSESVAARGRSRRGAIGFINPATSVRQASIGESGPVPEPSEPSRVQAQEQQQWAQTPGEDYGGDLMSEAQRYAGLCTTLAQSETFDVVHAHDWLTFPAGMAVAAATGRPLVVHVHATEFDRAGENINTQVYDIEQRGCQAAARVIAVSRRTKAVLVDRYGVAADKIEVVYNGIENGQANPHIKIPPKIAKDDKIVLFLGRVTMQKGPEYFIRAAQRVLEKMDNVKFVVAGSGDKIQEMIELVARAGIGSKVVFTGFLRGADVERVFKMADVYVMPSVSEPFGIAPLEAISNDVPVIISKQSGVSEVLENALKVDFWDTDEMANKIIAVLRHPPLGATLREQADLEVRRLTWDGAAQKCRAVYAAVAQ